MKLYAAITKFDAEQRMVFGYASTEALDSQNEIVKREALEAALPGYLKFANLREMHQPSAVGIAHQAEIDDKGLYIGAKVIDPLAWEKVKAGVYKGFSIGGNALKRDAANRNVITALELTEISLVDRPANPEAVFDLYKSDGHENGEENAPGDDSEDMPQWEHDLHDALDAALAQSDDTLDPVFIEAMKSLKAYLDEEDEEEGAGDTEALARAEPVGRLRKFELTIAEMGAECRRMAGEIERLAMAPLPAPIPAKGVLRVVAKGEDVGMLAKADAPVDALSAIKLAHQNPFRLV